MIKTQNQSRPRAQEGQKRKTKLKIPATFKRSTRESGGVRGSDSPQEGKGLVKEEKRKCPKHMSSQKKKEGRETTIKKTH